MFPAPTRLPAIVLVIPQLVNVNLDIVPANPAPRPILSRFQAATRLLVSVEATTTNVSASKENVLARAVANKRIFLSWFLSVFRVRFDMYCFTTILFLS